MLKKYIKNAKEIMDQNRSMVIMSIFMTSLTGLLMILSIYIALIGHHFSKYLNNSQKISILFDATTSNTEIASFINKYKQDPAITKIYQRKPEEVMRQMLPDNITISKEDLIKIVRIDLNPNSDSDNLINSILQEQKNNEDILEVIYLPTLYKKLKKVAIWGNIMSIFIIIISIIISLTLIYTTLKLGLEKLNKELQIMKDIGAPYSFIEKPLFLTTSFIILIGEILNMLLTFSIIFLFKYIVKQLDLEILLNNIINNLELNKYLSIYFIISILTGQFLIYLLISFYFTKKLTFNAYEKNN